MSKGEGGYVFFRASERSKWIRSEVDVLIDHSLPGRMIDIYEVFNKTPHVITFVKCENSVAPNKLFIDSGPTDLSWDLAFNQKLYFVESNGKLFLRSHDGEIVQYFEINPKEVEVKECILPKNRPEDTIGYTIKKKLTWVSLALD